MPRRFAVAAGRGTLSSSRPDALAARLCGLAGNTQIHLAWVGFFACFFVWFGFAPVAHAAVAELGHGEGAAVAVGLTNLLGSIPARLVMGRMTDRFGTRSSFTFLFGVSAVVVVLTATAGSLAVLFIARALAGFSGAAFVVAAKHAADHVPESQVGLAQGVVTGLGNLGIAAAAVALPRAGASADWIGLLGLTVAAVLWLVFSVNGSASGVSGRPRIRGRRFAVGLLSLAYAVTYGLQLAMGTALGRALTTTGFTSAQAGVAVGVLVAMNFFARPLGGHLLDSTQDKWRRLSVLLVGQTGGLVLAQFALWSGSFSASVAAVAVLGVFMISAAAGVYAIVPLVNPETTGRTAGVVASVGVVGAVLLTAVVEFKPAGIFLIPAGLTLVAAYLCFERDAELEREPARPE